MNANDPVEQALAIFSKWGEAAEREAGFDAGEFSGPACQDSADEEISRLARASDMSFDELMDLVTERQGREADAEHDRMMARAQSPKKE